MDKCALSGIKRPVTRILGINIFIRPALKPESIDFLDASAQSDSIFQILAKDNTFSYSTIEIIELKGLP